MQSELFPAAAPQLASVDWTPTRAAGLARLEAFVPRAGRAYARDRNVDRGPADRSNVSALSPWIRRRMITEEEVLAAVLRHHSFASAEKFIQEVFWRTYWKGWLELRPSTLTRFNTERLALKARLDQDPALRARYDRAVAGETGVACFDAWTQELRTIGWLHNHARMWFASIWIFTLQLPLQLGADFFYKHLIDADPASNTLSWRWVAGLHTRGKHYLARADNVARNTLQRFDPSGQLNERASPITEADAPAPRQAPPPQETLRSRRIALLLHEEDLHPENLDIDADVVGVAVLPPIIVGDPQGPAARFSHGAIDDASTRAARCFGVTAEVVSIDKIADWARGLGVDEIATPYAPVGLVAWKLTERSSTLAKDGIRLVRLQRDFDRRAWPYATSGYFKFREAMPQLLGFLSAPT